MKKIILALCLMYSNAPLAQAEEVCPKCEIIREENKKKVNPYEYYEDYLKNHPEKKNTPTPNPESK